MTEAPADQLRTMNAAVDVEFWQAQAKDLTRLADWEKLQEINTRNDREIKIPSRKYDQKFDQRFSMACDHIVHLRGARFDELKRRKDPKSQQLTKHIQGAAKRDVKTDHHRRLDAIRDVIWHLETYDVTTIRASTPMYLMARRIRAMGIKMVLSGEGADEIFGGYLYFHKAPDARAFHDETVAKLDALHMYDCLRANKSMAAWGIEARVPFLDRDLMDHAMTVLDVSVE